VQSKMLIINYTW